MTKKLIGYYETSDEAMEVARSLGATVVGSSISGKLAADIGEDRFWLHEVAGPASPHIGKWYWYGPFEQRAEDRFHALDDPRWVNEPRTAIERAETAWRNGDPKPTWDTLIELVRLAKIGERVERLETD